MCPILVFISLSYCLFISLKMYKDIEESFIDAICQNPQMIFTSQDTWLNQILCIFIVSINASKAQWLAFKIIPPPQKKGCDVTLIHTEEKQSLVN